MEEKLPADIQEGICQDWRQDPYTVAFRDMLALLVERGTEAGQPGNGLLAAMHELDPDGGRKFATWIRNCCYTETDLKRWEPFYCKVVRAYAGELEPGRDVLAFCGSFGALPPGVGKADSYGGRRA